MIDVITLLIIGALCLAIGFVFGSTYESLYGTAVKERERYFRMIMRMIPYLKEHYSDGFIYDTLVRNKNVRI